VDWNNDGKLDILSGCYWTQGAQAGHIYVLYGNGGLDFEQAVPVLNEEGNPLANVLISEDDVYSENESGAQITDAICTQQFLVDYNGNGVLDLVNGSFGKNFYLYQNYGTNEQPKLSANPVKIPVEFNGYHAAPHFCDWNNDGKLEMLTGSASGGVQVSYNLGTRAEPRWSPFQELIPGSDKHQQLLKGGAEPVPGPSTRVWAVDFNGDGLLDLLVGDSTRIARPADGMTEEEFLAKEEAFQAKVSELNTRRMELFQSRQQQMEKMLEQQEQGEEVEEDWAEAFNEEMMAIQNEMVELLNSRSEWCQEEATGHVWLYLRKPPVSISAPHAQEVEINE